MKNELLLQASLIEKEINQLEENIFFIEEQIIEMDDFMKSMVSNNFSNEKEIIAPLGKGVYIKSKIIDQDFIVNVGSGVLIKKTLEETIKIIEEQIKKLKDARLSLKARVEIVFAQFKDIVEKIEKS